MSDSMSHNLVDVAVHIPSIHVDLRYATSNNFTGKPLYSTSSCYVHKGLIPALQSIQQELHGLGLSLLIWDAYRPKRVQEQLKQYVSEPEYVSPLSNHSRGIAIDVTLCTKNGKVIPMPTEYDEFSVQAHHAYQNLPQDILDHRTLLKSILEKNGFTAYPYEWWHYDFLSLNEEPVLDVIL